MSPCGVPAGSKTGRPQIIIYHYKKILAGRIDCETSSAVEGINIPREEREIVEEKGMDGNGRMTR